MRKIRIYTQDNIVPPAEVPLHEAGRHHLYTVLRKKAGDEIYLFNDSDREYKTRIKAISKKECLLEILATEECQRESNLDITLYQALSKNDKMDWVIQKSVELGISRIVPVITEHSQIKLNSEKANKKREHWQSVIVSACEQSGRCRVPQVQLPENIKSAIDNCTSRHRLILHPHQGGKLHELDIDNKDSIALFIGPEGGFSEQEIKQCLASGFQSIRFGPRILRTETAPIAILGALQAIWGDC